MILLTTPDHQIYSMAPGDRLRFEPFTDLTNGPMVALILDGV